MQKPWYYPKTTPVVQHGVFITNSKIEMLGLKNMPERIRKILDSNLIEKFRETVNGNNHYVRYKYFKLAL